MQNLGPLPRATELESASYQDPKVIHGRIKVEEAPLQIQCFPKPTKSWPHSQDTSVQSRLRPELTPNQAVTCSCDR